MALAAAVRKAIRANPASMRALARGAGISHALLLRILTSERAVTRDVAERLAAALDRWGSDCTQAAESIRNAIERGRDK
jgi:transcriptional regulator with XRE-family HTH domain